MTKIRILLFRPHGNDDAAQDQALGARAAALYGPAGPGIDLVEDSFRRGDLGDLEKKIIQWGGRVAGIVGATNVAESTRLGEVAEKLGLLCFVANNNPSVRRGCGRVFHIGLPTRQTAEAVARLLEKGRFERVILVHDLTEFQSRVADSMKSQLEKRNIRVASRSGSVAGWLGDAVAWNPDLVYLVYSDEKKALPLALALREAKPEASLLFGRSLLRQSFIESLGAAAEGSLFVDLFRRGKQRSTEESDFMGVLAKQGVSIPTANHGFGWDMMSLCGLALAKGHGDVSSAVDCLESGIALTGVTGRFRFSRDNHNGREEYCPTRLSRSYRGQIIGEGYYA